MRNIAQTSKNNVREASAACYPTTGQISHQLESARFITFAFTESFTSVDCDSTEATLFHVVL